MTTSTQQTDDSATNPALARISPWERDARWPVIANVTPPRFVVRLSGPDEAAVLFAKVRADRRLMQQQIEAAHAERINVARAVFNAGDSTRKQLETAVNEAHAERIAREDRLAAFDDYTRDAVIERARQAAQAANERAWRESIASVAATPLTRPG